MLIFNSSIRPKVQCAAIKVRDDMVGRTLGQLNCRADMGILVLLIEREAQSGTGTYFINCPNYTTKFQKGDYLYIAGKVDELGNFRQELADEKETNMSLFRPYYPEFDQFQFPENCHNAIVGPVSFCRKAGQKALNLRNAFDINLVAISRANAEVLGPRDIGPDTEILPGDVGVVCRVPVKCGFSKSVFTMEHYNKLRIQQLKVSTMESAQRRCKDLEEHQNRQSVALADGKQESRLPHAKTC